MTTPSHPETTQTHNTGDEHHGDHGAPFMAHHFDSAEQQFDAGKLGMWIFLVTEVLFFSGLFVVYIGYRMMHPEIFQYASEYLNKYLGGINTAILLFSSLTMAWGVRCAQLKQRKGLILCLTLTLFCAALFLGVKTFEYTEKFHKRLLWTSVVDPLREAPKFKGFGGSQGSYALVLEDVNPAPEDQFEARVTESLSYIQTRVIYVTIGLIVMCAVGYTMRKNTVFCIGLCGTISMLGILIGIYFGIGIHQALHPPPEKAPEKAKTALADNHTTDDAIASEKHEDHAHSDGVEHHDGAGHAEEHHAESHGPQGEKPRYLYTFFSIYYMMTGLHAFHIIAGMIAISWLIVRAFADHFRPDYFGPVDYVGLYWHLVDLIWIFLFPLLYLIH